MLTALERGNEMRDQNQAQLLFAIQELENSIDFFESVQSASEDERIAVGRDHYDWLLRAARLVVSVSTIEILSPDFQPGQDPEETHTAMPLETWHEDYGDVIWWSFPIEEPPWCGTPLDSDWPGYHTHWTRLSVPQPEDNNNHERTRTKTLHR